jgi:hypothetical protein
LILKKKKKRKISLCTAVTAFFHLANATPSVCTGSTARGRGLPCRATTKRPARLSVAHACTQRRCPSFSRRAPGRRPRRQRSRAYSVRSTYKLLMAGTTTSTVTSPSPPPLPPSSTLASATAATDSSRPPPRLRSDSPLRLPPAAPNLINRFVRVDVR